MDGLKKWTDSVAKDEASAIARGLTSYGSLIAGFLNEGNLKRAEETLAVMQKDIRGRKDVFNTNDNKSIGQMLKGMEAAKNAVEGFKESEQAEARAYEVLGESSKQKFLELPKDIRKQVGEAGKSSSRNYDDGAPAGGSAKTAEIGASLGPKERQKAFETADKAAERYAGPAADKVKGIIKSADDTSRALVREYGEKIGTEIGNVIRQAEGKADKVGAGRSAKAYLVAPGLRKDKYDDNSAVVLVVEAVNNGNGQFTHAIRTETISIRNRNAELD